MNKDLLKSSTDDGITINDMMRTSFGRHHKVNSLRGPDGDNIYSPNMPLKEDCGCGNNHSQVNPPPPPGYYDNYPQNNSPVK